jgi:hypothetical protein
MAHNSTARTTATVINSYQKFNIKDTETHLYPFSRKNISTNSLLLTEILPMEIDTNTGWSIGICQVNTEDGKSPVMIQVSNQTNTEWNVSKHLTDSLKSMFSENNHKKLNWDILLDPQYFKDKTKNIYEIKLEIILIAQ